MAGQTKCPKCKDRLIQRLGTMTRVRVEGPLEIDEAGNCFARCFWCKARVPVPLKLTLEPKEISRERYIVREM